MLTIEVEREDDGRWLAEVVDLPGVLAYGRSEHEAINQASCLALLVLAERTDPAAYSAALRLDSRGKSN